MNEKFQKPAEHTPAKPLREHTNDSGSVRKIEGGIGQDSRDVGPTVSQRVPDPAPPKKSS